MVELVIGIVSGILTSWFLYFVKVLFDTKVTPYLRETKYQGVKIEGIWVGENTESASRLLLEQSAHELTGSLTINFKVNAIPVLDFNVRGYMWEGFITLNMIPKDRRITSYATALLKLHDGGYQLVGKWCFRNVQTEEVEAWPMSLARDLPKKTNLTVN